MDDQKTKMYFYDAFQVGKSCIPTWLLVEIGGKHNEACSMMDDSNIGAKEL